MNYMYIVYFSVLVAKWSKSNSMYSSSTLWSWSNAVKPRDIHWSTCNDSDLFHSLLSLSLTFNSFFSTSPSLRIVSLIIFSGTNSRTISLSSSSRASQRLHGKTYSLDPWSYENKTLWLKFHLIKIIIYNRTFDFTQQ